MNDRSDQEEGITSPPAPPVRGPSAGIAFGVALASLAISGVLFFQVQGLRAKLNRQLEESAFLLHRTAALLEELGLTLEPGPEYEGLGLRRYPSVLPDEAARALDDSKTAVALGQLRTIQTAFVMRMAEEDRGGFPASTEIRSYADLREHLSDYAFLPDDPLEKGWVFLGYLRPARDSFLLLTEARNAARTLITVTPERITPWSMTP